MMEEKYVIVTTTSTFRMRYCIPVSELQKQNPDVPVRPIEWAKDSVTMEEVEEFSQLHLGEQIVDAVVLNESETLELFDDDNSYLQSWTKDQKLKHINDWKQK